AGPGCQNVQRISGAPWHHRRPRRAVVHVGRPFDGVRLPSFMWPHLIGPLHRQGRKHIPQERRGATLVPVPAQSVEAHRGMQQRAYL
ncbi:MAG: hypothetical protein AVDCRST_MAG93-4182, partial [uncultured Chloroflexia bacterium]